MTARLNAAVMAAALIAASGVTSAAPAMADRPASAADFHASDFYDAPPIPAAARPGTVLRTQDFTPGMDAVLGLSALAVSTKIMYVSVDSHGRPMAVTGTVFRPRATWAGPGIRPLIGLAAGAHGMGVNCLQSRSFEQPIQLYTPLDMSVGYEVLAVKSLLERGFAVAVTDYPRVDGVQTYLNHTDEGRAVIDSVRAARQLSGIPAGPVAFWGYSQGGGAAAAAGEMQSAYAPELAVRAIYAGAAPADILSVLRMTDGGAGTDFLMWTVASALATEPSLRPAVAAVLNADGTRAVDRARTECLGAAVMHGFVSSRAYTRSGRPLPDELAAIPAFAAWLRRQSLGSVAPNAPVLVHAARHDDVVPYDVQLGLANSWRARGANVTVLTYEAPSILPGLYINHSLPHQLDNDRVLAWLTERLTG